MAPAGNCILTGSVRDALSIRTQDPLPPEPTLHFRAITDFISLGKWAKAAGARGSSEIPVLITQPSSLYPMGMAVHSSPSLHCSDKSTFPESPGQLEVRPTDPPAGGT